MYFLQQSVTSLTHFPRRDSMLGTILNLFAGADLLILLAAIIFFFGGKLLPAVPRTIRAAIKEFRRGQRNGLRSESDLGRNVKPNNDQC
jgi:Sec-independent protein translocase protein TatA